MKIYLGIATVAALSLVLINIYSEKLTPKSHPIPPAPELAHAHLGFRSAMADSYWLRLIQDLEYCGQDAVPLEKSLNPTGGRIGPDRTPGCSKGWSYYMLSLITDLDPRFHYATVMGPMSLSVVTDDIDGATLMFEKATRLYPNDWLIHYQAGYHHMVELEDYEGAVNYFKSAQKLGAPRWLPLLIARLQTKDGKTWLAKATLENYLKAVQDDPGLKARTEKKLEALRKGKN